SILILHLTPISPLFPCTTLFRSRALFLLELERHVEQALLHALGRHRFAEEGEVIAEHEDRAWVVHLLVRSHELLEEDRRHGGDVDRKSTSLNYIRGHIVCRLLFD